MRKFEIECMRCGIISKVSLLAKDLDNALEIVKTLKPKHTYRLLNPSREDIIEIMERLKEV